MPFFSVIIPCYNSKFTIEKCLKHLEQQTFKNFDVIIIDDCSTDSTYEFLKNEKKRSQLKIELISNSLNSGPAISRNIGISASKSEYIAFCDSDDWYEVDFLELMYEEIQRRNADMVFCNSQRVFKNGNKLFLNNFSGLDGEITKNNMLISNIDSLGAITIRRNIISKIQIPHLRNGEDMAVIPILISNAESYGIVNKYIYNYYYNNNSLSTNVSKDVVDSLLNSFQHIEENLVGDLKVECEYLGVRNVLYGALLNNFKLGINIKVANDILTDFELRYPNWEENKYTLNLPYYKKIFLKLVKKRRFLAVWTLSNLHTFLLKSK